MDQSADSQPQQRIDAALSDTSPASSQSYITTPSRNEMPLQIIDKFDMKAAATWRAAQTREQQSSPPSVSVTLQTYMDAGGSPSTFVPGRSYYLPGPGSVTRLPDGRSLISYTNCTGGYYADPTLYPGVNFFPVGSRLYLPGGHGSDDAEGENPVLASGDESNTSYQTDVGVGSTEESDSADCSPATSDSMSKSGEETKKQVTEQHHYF